MYGCDVREVRRGFRGSIDGSARVLFNSLTRSEKATSGHGKREYDSEYSSYFFHSNTS